MERRKTSDAVTTVAMARTPDQNVFMDDYSKETMPNPSNKRQTEMETEQTAVLAIERTTPPLRQPTLVGPTATMPPPNIAPNIPLTEPSKQNDQTLLRSPYTSTTTTTPKQEETYWPLLTLRIDTYTSTSTLTPPVSVVENNKSSPLAPQRLVDQERTTPKPMYATPQYNNIGTEPKTPTTNNVSQTRPPRPSFHSSEKEHGKKHEHEHEHKN
jgi:hypothetical protein